MAIKYAENIYSRIESKQDDCRPYGQQPDGYGRKIATPYLVRFDGRGPWRRVYCCIFSNSGTLYAVVNGEWVCFKCDENLRINGEWPANECAAIGNAPQMWQWIDDAFGPMGWFSTEDKNRNEKLFTGGSWREVPPQEACDSMRAIGRLAYEQS